VYDIYTERTEQAVVVLFKEPGEEYKLASLQCSVGCHLWQMTALS